MVAGSNPASPTIARHETVLANAGLVTVDKGFVGNRPRTWLRATAKGRATFRAEMTALSKLVARFKGTSKAP